MYEPIPTPDELQSDDYWRARDAEWRLLPPEVRDCVPRPSQFRARAPSAAELKRDQDRRDRDFDRRSGSFEVAGVSYSRRFFELGYAPVYEALVVLNRAGDVVLVESSSGWAPPGDARRVLVFVPFS